MGDLLEIRPTEVAESRRIELTKSLEATRRAELGQFFTPLPAARLIASMFPRSDARLVRLLDPGAGVGSLTAAAVERYADFGVEELHVVAWEIEPQLQAALRATLESCVSWGARRGLSVRWQLRSDNYLTSTAAAVAGELEAELEQFDVVIMNPPYRKVGVGAPERNALDRVGVPVTNLYTAFMALAVAQLRPGGVLTAITPRSFANGRYAAPFRRFFFDRVAIEKLHLFESRSRVFADANVLQENVVLTVSRGGSPRTVQLSSSQGHDDVPRTRTVPVEEILRPDDPQRFLRIPDGEKDAAIAETMTRLPASLEDLGIAVSTGRVVEFRAREFLRLKPSTCAAPLIRPNHLREGRVRWPDPETSKPNALAIAPESQKLLLPNDTYVLVKRMTAKEEAKRVRAAVSEGPAFTGRWIAFENHLNVFHRENHGLPEGLAHGLAAYLNSSFVDRYVRQFNGHTQINATDLRHLRYPDAEVLERIGAACRAGSSSAQADLDEIVESVLDGSEAGELMEVA